MDYFQSKIRLSAETILTLKALAERLGLSYSSLCEQILKDAAIKLIEQSYFWRAGNAVKAKIDIENSRLRSKANKEKKNVEYHEYPQEIAAYIFNQYCRDNDLS